MKKVLFYLTLVFFFSACSKDIRITNFLIVGDNVKELQESGVAKRDMENFSYYLYDTSFKGINFEKASIIEANGKVIGVLYNSFFSGEDDAFRQKMKMLKYLRVELTEELGRPTIGIQGEDGKFIETTEDPFEGDFESYDKYIQLAWKNKWSKSASITFIAYDDSDASLSLYVGSSDGL